MPIVHFAPKPLPPTEPRFTREHLLAFMDAFQVLALTKPEAALTIWDLVLLMQGPMTAAEIIAQVHTAGPLCCACGYQLLQGLS
jgi:hypothetical protein